MKAVLVLVLVSLAAHQLAAVQTLPTRKPADEAFLKRQQIVLELLVGIGHKHLFQSEYKDFDIKSNANLYTDPKVVEDFWYEYEHGFLLPGQEFTLDSPRVLRQTIKLFDLFYYAKDFNTFIKTASWARKHLNDVQFAYVYYVAVYHRADCRGLVLPPLYEVFPESFITQEVMHKIYDAKMDGVQSLKVYMNSTGWEEYWHRKSYGSGVHASYDAPFNNVEERISYFREDVGLNDYLGQISIFYPSWLDQSKYPKITYFRRGEVYYYIFQQLLARYTLERYANYMPEIDMLYWDQPIMIGYNPHVLSPNGQVLYPRAFNMIPKTYNPSGVWKAETYEWKIAEDIGAGIIFYNSNSSYGKLPLKDVIDTWGNIMAGTPDIIDHDVYGDYFHSAMDAIAHIVKTGGQDDYVTGAMGHIMSAGRDPAFYMFLRRLMSIFHLHTDLLPSYTKEELSFPGIKIESFEIGKLLTYFERFDVEATFGLPLSSGQSYKDYHYIAKQARLNHKPFTYKLTISSDKPVDAIVRVFLGPKYDSHHHPLTMDEARTSFVEIDRFPLKLTNGENVIERNSKESTGYVRESYGYRYVYEHVKSSLNTKEPFYYTDSYKCGLPERLLLPKGSAEGLPLMFYTIVSPFDHKVTTPVEERIFESQILCGGSKYYDGRAYGYPFDRHIEYDHIFEIPNIHYDDVLVYHTDETIINKPE